MVYFVFFLNDGNIRDVVVFFEAKQHTTGLYKNDGYS